MKIGEIVRIEPAHSGVFERYGLDYCCGGGRTLEEACAAQRIDPAVVLEELQAVDPAGDVDENPIHMSLTQLADHILGKHHSYLHTELPRIRQLIDKVVMVHGAAYPWLYDVRRVFGALASELEQHMEKEERVLFPMIRELERSATTAGFHCGTIRNPIRAMEHEHDSAGRALSELRELTHNYSPPRDACNTFRAMLDALSTMETDTHQHIHKENNILFPKAIRAEELIA